MVHELQRFFFFFFFGSDYSSSVFELCLFCSVYTIFSDGGGMFIRSVMQQRRVASGGAGRRDSVRCDCSKQ